MLPDTETVVRVNRLLHMPFTLVNATSTHSTQSGVTCQMLNPTPKAARTHLLNAAERTG